MVPPGRRGRVQSMEELYTVLGNSSRAAKAARWCGKTHEWAYNTVMRITHEIGQWIGLTDDNGVERLRYDYASAPKPFIHPIKLPDGTVITEHEPADHIWHRGLWFAFKFVNGINYWEERDEVIGYQKILASPHAIFRKDKGFQITSGVWWKDQEK